MLDLFDRLIGCHFVVIVDGVEVDESEIFKFTEIIRGADDSVIVQGVIGRNLKTYPLNCIRLKVNGMLFKILQVS